MATETPAQRLLSDCMRLRQETGRTTTWADRERLFKKISALSPAELGAEGKNVRAHLAIALGRNAPAAVQRNKP